MNAAKQDCPPRLELAAWASNVAMTSNADATPIALHVPACPKCAGYVQQLQEARQELLGDDPVWTSRNAARTILATAEARKRARWGWRLAWPMAALPVAALVALFAVPREGSVSSTKPAERLTAADTVRTKGAFALAIVSKRGETLLPIGDGDEVLSGDRLRFEYTQAQSGFLMVFSVDDKGTISPYYDEHTLQSVPVVAGSRVPLPGSIELDDHKGIERVFALWSVQPLDGAEVRTAVGQAMAAVGGNVEQLAKLPLQAEQTSTLLRRP